VCVLATSDLGDGVTDLWRVLARYPEVLDIK
jgi:hypothetical protein